MVLVQICHAEIHTFCFGLAASMGAFLLGAGAKGKRASMPNSRIMIHQPLGGCSGQAVDIEIQAREIMYHKANINRIMADYTGQPISKVGGPLCDFNLHQSSHDSALLLPLACWQTHTCCLRAKVMLPYKSGLVHLKHGGEPVY